MSALWPKVPCSGFCVRRTANKKPKALTSGLNSLCRQSKLWRQYQIYMKYMRFSSVLQDLHLNLSPFVVNVIALLR